MRRCQQEIYRFRCSANKQLYFVRCDVQNAFDSIIQGIFCVVFELKKMCFNKHFLFYFVGKLFNIIKSCSEKLPDSLPLRYYTLRKSRYDKNRNKNKIIKICKDRTVQFEDLKRSIGKKGFIDETKKSKWMPKTKLFGHIKRLIYAQKVKKLN